jgi:Glycosyl hydrolases family 2, TIM barrel domain/Glycosyl hydrolases family 2, sugar binding domain/Beta galactosidase small chain/Beta-galactosidase, domain 4/Glycosyl hydrolases family 2
MKPISFFRRAALGVLALAGWPAAALAAPARPADPDATWIQYLSGHGKDDAVPWDFYCTGGRHSGVWTTIPVPSCWEQEGFGTYQYGVLLRSKKHAPPVADEQGKYRLEFTVPADWSGRVVRLVFGGAMTDTAAWVNGQPAGPVHQGAFYQFHYDITRLLKFGAPNRLEVTVSKESANPSVNAAERRGDYWNFGGIFRPVWLEALPAAFIDRAAIDARADGGFTADVYLGGKPGGPARVEGQIETLDGAPVGKPFAAGVPAGATEATLHTRLDGVKLWTAETPNLYRVRLTLSGAEAGDPGAIARHTVVQPFGFRTFEVRPHDGLYLNGRKIVLKGICRHSFWPESGRTLSREVNYEDVRLIKEMNMNAVRMSHYPPDADFLQACDELGLYVLDELGGWHGCYDTPTGRKLIGEMVRRDVNHPSILFWDNGNETGWNAENDGQFARWDPQHRPVLHPIGVFSGIDTMHYRDYAETRARCAGPDIFLPTEFLHGLYDGGLGAGFDDYWEVMRRSPLCAGGFFWAFLDEGVVRTDENGRIDEQGDLAPDGIVGPHREKEGSFFTVRQIWSPVQVGPDRLPAHFDGRLQVENRYDFTNLDRCRFDWSLARFPAPADGRAGHTVIAAGTVPGPAVAPHAAGELRLALPADWRQADALYVTAVDPAGRSLWTWSWSWQPDAALAGPMPREDAAPVAGRDDGIQLAVRVGALDLRFNKGSGMLDEVLLHGRPIPLHNGPRFIAERRADRNPDGSVRPHVERGVDRRYDVVPTPARLTSLGWRNDGDAVVVEADYDGALRQALWRITPDGDVRLDYTYDFEGAVDLMGVQFDYPEAAMQAIRWLGMGPYRVWQNRLKGTTLDVWQNAYNNTTPDESYVYPEFKGYFRDWRWAVFTTTAGDVTLVNDHAGRYLGVYSPPDGKVGPLAVFPPAGLAVLDVIPAMRNKVDASDLLGPQSQVVQAAGLHHGTIHLRFAAPAPGEN